ncbi:phosphoglycerate kinase [Patescibacteria group bacterium]|nr:phosphoglycerate kinase [Patescibacteria group bacterium]
MQGLKSVRDTDVQGKRVLVRVDFNVPFNEALEIVDDSRIRSAIPTLNYLHEKGAAKIILLTHVGRPEGKEIDALKIAPIAKHLQSLVSFPEIELRENLRFDPREEKNDGVFAKELAALGDVYVNEAFSASHRADTSIVGIPKLLPSYAGLRFEEEVEHISAALTPPQPALAIVGGAKFETKQPLLEKLLSQYSEVLLGGALANDLLKARGLPVGASLISAEGVPAGLAQNTKLGTPVDVVVALGSAARATNTGDVRQAERIVDIGDRTTLAWSKKINNASFVLWNGPTGIYEQGFTKATQVLAQALVQSSCKALIGGGDTAAALSNFSFDPSRIFVSTGGGAMLQLLADGTLPGIEALKGSAV